MLCAVGKISLGSQHPMSEYYSFWPFFVPNLIQSCQCAYCKEIGDSLITGSLLPTLANGVQLQVPCFILAQSGLLRALHCKPVDEISIFGSLLISLFLRLSPLSKWTRQLRNIRIPKTAFFSSTKQKVTGVEKEAQPLPTKG